MDLITEKDLVFTDGIIFKSFYHVVCEISPPHNVPSPSVAGTGGSCMGATLLFSWRNDVLDMLNCWDACRVEVVGWFSKNAYSLLSSVTTMDFRPDALYLAPQTVQEDPNLTINQSTMQISVRLPPEHQSSDDFKITATSECNNLPRDYNFTSRLFLSELWTTCPSNGDITSVILIKFSYDK